jgi:hypothetical protein
LLVEADGKFYFIPAKRFQDALRRIKQPSDSLDGLLIADNLTLE